MERACFRNCFCKMSNCVVLLLEEEQANSNFWEVRGQSRRSVFSESCWRNSALKDSISVFTHREPRVPSKCPGDSRWPLHRASLGSLYHWLEGFNRSPWFRFPEISVPSWFYCVHLLSVLHKYAFASTTLSSFATLSVYELVKSHGMGKGSVFSS